MKIVFLSLTLLAFASSVKFRFDNYTLFRVVPKNEQQIKLLHDLQEHDDSFDFWDDPVPNVQYVNIMSSPVNRNGLETLLDNSGIEFEITMTNIQEVIDKETVTTYTRNTRNMQWDAYYTLNDIESWMNDISNVYSDVATPIVGGESFEGRPIRGLKISHGSGRKVIFIESGIHAREWISPATACYIINELLTSNNEETMAAARDFDWHIFPVTNPDGYVWTHEEYRLWRKNRRPVGSQFGIDLNRNWNSNWLGLGTSINPASNTFAGAGPFSEPEARTLSTYIRSLAADMDLYISFHSSGQLLLLPYGNTTDPLDNYFDAINIGRRAMGALAVRHGTQYTTGNIAEAIYFATGTSIDWVKERLRVPLVYCYELRDRGQFGHLLPADQILPNNQEVMDSLLELIHQARRFGYMNTSSGVGVQASWMLLTLVSLRSLF